MRCVLCGFEGPGVEMRGIDALAPQCVSFKECFARMLRSNPEAARFFHEEQKRLARSLAVVEEPG